MKASELIDGMAVRNINTGNVGIVRDSIRPKIYGFNWVEVHVERSTTGKTFTANWSLSNIEPINETTNAPSNS